MIFSRHKVSQNSDLKINNFQIKRVQEARFLGVIIDEKLTWSAHIKAIKSKMSRYIGIMYKIKSKIPENIRLQIYHSFVQSHLNFCCLVWGFSKKTNIDTIFTAQKKAMRAVMPGYVNYYFKDGQLPTSTKNSFNQSGVLSIHGIIANQAIQFIHKAKNFPSLIPISVKSTIKENILNMPILDQSDPIFLSWVEEFNTHIYRNSLFFKGPLLYFDPTTVRNYATPAAHISFNVFRSQTKKFLLRQQAEGSKNDWKTNDFAIFSIRCFKTARHYGKIVDYKKFFHDNIDGPTSINL